MPASRSGSTSSRRRFKYLRRFKVIMNRMRATFVVMLIFFIAITPFARKFYGVQWTIPAALILGTFIALAWKRFPEWTRRSKLQEAAGKKALAEITAEIGKRAMWTRLWGPVI